MVVEYNELFTTADPINHNPVTVSVEYIEGEGVQAVLIRTLEGGYDSKEDFKKGVKHFFDVMERALGAAKPYMNPRTKEDDLKLYKSILLSRHDARRLADALNEALHSAQEP